MPRAALAPLLGLLLAASPATAEPALWRVADADTTIYLFGTIHALPEGFEWRDARVDRAIDEADELVIETLIPEEPEAAARMLIAMGMAGAQPPLVERIAPEERAVLRAMIARSAVPEFVLDRLETWAAALMLVGVVLADLGLDAESGVEEALEARFAAAGKPIAGLETPREQLGFLDSADEGAQRELLASVVDDPAATRANYQAMLDAWSAGDEAGIAASFEDDLRRSEPLREALLVRRNANWARWIAERMERPGTAFVAVGAAHLVGRERVQDFLDEAGIVAERVE